MKDLLIRIARVFIILIAATLVLGLFRLVFGVFSPELAGTIYFFTGVAIFIDQIAYDDPLL